MVSKLLIITDFMMPFSSNWGGCQRVYHYAKKMVNEGIGVSVICRNVSDRTDGKETVDGISVIGLGGGQTPAEPGAQHGFKAELREKLKAIDRNVKVVSTVVRGVYRFLYSEPNVLAGRVARQWANIYLSYILQYIREEKIDTVILSGPAFGMFYHAATLKACGVKLILDYRDPWVSWYEKPTLADSAEKKAVECADLVVTTTETLTEALNKKYRTAKCHTVMNGYDEKLWESVEIPEHDPDMLLISYVGNIVINRRGGFRDPAIFLDAVKVFKEAHPEVAVQFVGVQDDLKEIDPALKKYVEFRNTVPVTEAQELTAAADVLLVFHTALDPSGKYIICGKVFDCMRSGNYILSIGDMAYANKAFVERTASGIHCNNDKTAILEALETIYQKKKTVGLADTNRNTELYSRECQNTEFLRLIHEM